MSGTRLGGLKARDKNVARDPDWYRKIGQRGGRNGNTGGFAQKRLCMCDEIKGVHRKPQCAGSKGGRVSRRTKKEEV